jgi:polyferredoxin
VNRNVDLESQHKSAALTRSAHPQRIKKIPVGLRRRGARATGGSLMRPVIWRMKNDSQFLRASVQAAFALLCIWIGVEFHLFVQWGMMEGASFHSRPPGIEGFLPISSLISLKYWLQAGVITSIHPAGLFIFVAVLALSAALKKAFCSWMCPIGTLSESLWMLGRKLFGRNLQITRWLDYPLRSLKYLLLFFFLYFILPMDIPSLKSFIESPYNRMADVKMYLFFANISSMTLWTILVLIVLSTIIRNFWCRYLCPYGALLGVASLLSPLKITRQSSTCIDCALCTRACPSAIKVHKVDRVWSDECTACLKCVDVCPVKNTLDVRTRKAKGPVSSWAVSLLVVGVFVGITGMAMLTGHWQNSITKQEYGRRLHELDSPAYEHFNGRVGENGRDR